MVHPTLRRCLFWTHLAVGVIVGLLILSMAVTGILMSFQTQIIGRAERGMVVESAVVKGDPAGPEELLQAWRAAGLEGRPTALLLSSDPGDPVIFQIGREGQQLFHPTTTDPLGKGAEKTRGFFKFAESLHRWLALSKDRQDLGKGITGAATLGFGFLLLSGWVLWVPRKFSKKAFKAVTLPQARLKGRARDWNWHNLAGFWASPLLAVSIVTGTIMAYPWANELLFKSVGEQPPVKREGGEGGRRERGGRGGEDKPIAGEGMDDALATMKKEFPSWTTISFDLTADAEKPVTATVSDSVRGRPDRKVKLTLDRGTSEIIAREGFDKQTPGTRLRQWVRWIHTGEAGGIGGQIAAALSAAAAILLVYTGFALAIRRLAGTLKKRGAPPAGDDL